MKTIRTIIATLSAVLLAFALVAWVSVRRNAAFIQRTIYQGFDQTFVVALVMGCAFLLIAIILTVAIVSIDDDEEDEEDEAPVRPKPRSRTQPAADRRPAEEKHPAPRNGEQPYRRVSRNRTMDQGAPRKQEDSAFARPKAEEQPLPRKREKAASRPDQIALRRDEPSGQREKKARKVEAAEPAAEVFAEAEALLKEMPQPLPVPEEQEPVPAPEAAELPAEPEEATEASAEPEEAPAEPEEAPEVPEEAEAPAPEAPVKEDTVRCVFCGSTISRDCLFCPRCGKKR